MRIVSEARLRAASRFHLCVTLQLGALAWKPHWNSVRAKSQRRKVPQS